MTVYGPRLPLPGLESDEDCGKCGGPIRLKWSGWECTHCDNWDCA